MTKNVLVIFNMQIGEYEHSDQYIFNKIKSEWGYCKEFWGISKKDELKENVFWDDERFENGDALTVDEIEEE